MTWSVIWTHCSNLCMKFCITHCSKAQLIAAVFFNSLGVVGVSNIHF